MVQRITLCVYVCVKQYMQYAQINTFPNLLKYHPGHIYIYYSLMRTFLPINIELYLTVSGSKLMNHEQKGQIDNFRYQQEL